MTKKMSFLVYNRAKSMKNLLSFDMFVVKIGHEFVEILSFMFHIMVRVRHARIMKMGAVGASRVLVVEFLVRIFRRKKMRRPAI